MDIGLGSQIRRMRRDAGLTLERLAEALGVTAGAVYKWESGKATPELGMLVEIAAFFETSVDALLNYGWETLSMGKAVERLRELEKKQSGEESLRYAEKVLQKYPNSFGVVYHSAEVYFLTMTPDCMARARELYERALPLLNQNMDRTISALTIESRIATCLCYMNRTEEAIAIYKDNNAGGMYDDRIGLLLSPDPEKSEEALDYLSRSLIRCYSQLFNTVIGYANAYENQKKLDETAELILWLYRVGVGLREPAVVNWMDRVNVALFIILANLACQQGKEPEACDWLRRARTSAVQFDAAPVFHAGSGMKFYHQQSMEMTWDDMGGTAMEIIQHHIKDTETGKDLLPLWQKICEEEEHA